MKQSKKKEECLGKITIKHSTPKKENTVVKIKEFVKFE